MGFWSGFEGLTGHRPGAFKGFRLKDIIDKDMWERRERLGGRQSRQFEQTGVVPTTNWYRGRGRPEMMGPRVGAVSPQVQLNPAEKRASDLMRNQGIQAVQESPKVGELPSYAEQFANMYPDKYSPDVVSAARPWANIQAQMLSDLRQVPRHEPRWIDKTTTVKESSAIDVPDTTTTVYKEKLDSAATWQPEAGAKARPFWGLMDWYRDLARRRHEESMMNRTWRGY